MAGRVQLGEETGCNSVKGWDSSPVTQESSGRLVSLFVLCCLAVYLFVLLLFVCFVCLLFGEKFSSHSRLKNPSAPISWKFLLVLILNKGGDWWSNFNKSSLETQFFHSFLIYLLCFLVNIGLKIKKSIKNKNIKKLTNNEWSATLSLWVITSAEYWNAGNS